MWRFDENFHIIEKWTVRENYATCLTCVPRNLLYALYNSNKYIVIR